MRLQYFRRLNSLQMWSFRQQLNMQIRSRDLIRPEDLSAKMATVYTNCDEMVLLPDKSQERQQEICAWPFSIISLILKINGYLY